MARTLRVFILLAFFGATFAVPKNVERIVGGSPTTVESYPYMSNIQYGVASLDMWFQACGGSLITSRSVLSAAHCFSNNVPAFWRVRLGTSYASSGGTVHAVAQIIEHEDYRFILKQNDIAIIRLATPAVFSDVIGVARIPGVNYNLADGTSVTAIGWGALAHEGPAPEQLQHVNVNIINQEYCVAQYAYLKTQPGHEFTADVQPEMLCAGIQYEGGKDACQGDSGGPLAHNDNVVVGITSWGHNCAHPDYPGVNVRVNSYVDWIVSNA